MAGTGLACKLCQSLIACGKDEADDFARKLGIAILSNSSAISSIDLCRPCFESARNKAAENPPPKEPAGGMYVDDSYFQRNMITYT